MATDYNEWSRTPPQERTPFKPTPILKYATILGGEHLKAFGEFVTSGEHFETYTIIGNGFHILFRKTANGQLLIEAQEVRSND
jgi:hypothetical protein